MLERAGDAGVEVSVSIQGERRPLPAGADLVAYRIVQEAVTNVLRHSGAPNAQLVLSFGAGELTIEVLDGGVGTNGSSLSDRGGHGLAGIRERAALYDGRVETGPQADGGFAVRAWLPLSVPTASPGSK